MSCRSLVARVYVALLLILAAGCAHQPPRFPHTFQFDVRTEAPGIDVLDFRYGTSSQPGTQMSQFEKVRGDRQQSSHIYASMPRPDELYVKWRDNRSGRVYEDRVDLKRRLPADISNHEITFIPRGDQLYVYLVTPERRGPNDAPNGPKATNYLKTITLYPDTTK